MRPTSQLVLTNTHLVLPLWLLLHTLLHGIDLTLAVMQQQQLGFFFNDCDDLSFHDGSSCHTASTILNWVCLGLVFTGEAVMPKV